ncbi:MAG: TSUP family transporter [Halofilum sp. (in: g-proteobacteria)]|nr:TSUP family transporter [Halofilum sp. (in: g-proteobacteria)]
MSALFELVALPGAASWVTPLLAGIAVFTACLTTALGAGGGLLLLAVMTLFLPVSSVIPLHGAIQLGATTSRTGLLLRHVRLRLLLSFAIGALLGAAAGSRILFGLTEAWLEILLGAFILCLAWMPLPRLRRAPAGSTLVAGAVTSVLTLFLGATGPLVSAFLAALRLDRLAHVGTFAACMTVQHGLKIAVFGMAGFAFGPFLPFLLLMLAATALGNWIGKRTLEGLDDSRFHRLLAVVLTLLAARLLYRGWADLLN